MFWWSQERTVEWLAARGIARAGDDAWTIASSEQSLTDDDLAHELGWAPGDPDLNPEDRLMLWFGLLDLLDNYASAMYLAWEFNGVKAAFADRLPLVWEFCREVLERPEKPSGVPYWLWVDWFEDPVTSTLAFTSVVGVVSSAPADLRRVDRVLRVSGPVPWETKRPLFEKSIAFAELHAAVLEGLQGSVRDVYGQVDPDGAIAILNRLRLNGLSEELAVELTARVKPSGP